MKKTGSQTNDLELDLPDEADIVHVQPTPARRIDPKEAKAEFLREVEDKIYRDSMEVLDAHLAFATIDPDSEAPPQEWVEAMGEEKARQRWLVAKSGWMNQKEAPNGVIVAMKTALGVMKARATEQKGKVQNLNMVVVQMVGPAQTYDAVDIEEEEK